jgi:uncharacterized protein with HEPN domain
MTGEESRKYLWDASNAAERILRFIGKRVFDDYLEDEMLRAAVERQFEIIGEALSRLRRVDSDKAAAVPDLGRIVAFRNILIHAYATVDDHLVWGVIESELPKLRAALDLLLAGSP